MWSAAREWLRSHGGLATRLLLAALSIVLVPIWIASLLPREASAIVWALLIVDLIVVMTIAALVLVLGERLIAPLMASPVDAGLVTVAIGPECVAMGPVGNVVVPWQYVHAVEQDPWFIAISLSPGMRTLIPRRAFANPLASVAFGMRAWLYWRRAGHASL